MTENDEKTILVTGATGTVGSEVVKQLTASSSSGQSVIRAAVHSQNKADKFKSDNKTVEIVNIDYNKPETIADALDHVDTLFLVTLPAPNMANISSSLVKEAKKNGVKYIVKLSVMKADAEPGFIVGRLHRQAEKIIEESGIPYTFLRPTSFMQNFVNFYSQTIRTKNAFYIHAEDVKFSFVDVRDIAAVAVKLLTKNGSQHENKAYGLTGQKALSYSQAAEILSKEIGKKISYIDIPEEDARKGLKQIGFEDWLINAVMEGFNYFITGGYGSQTTTVVEQVTGRRPISFEQFVRDYANSFS
jgi:uncharacterized protein YbjT (DUF2867 family)